MVELDVRPDTVDLLAYAGDTLTVQITAPASITDGMTWTAQVRAARATDTVAADWVVTPPTSSGGPAYITLPADVTAGLVVGAGTVVVRRDGSTRSVQQFTGVWDCQVSAAGSDPVRTLVQGSITVELDVTRVGP